MKRFLTLIGVLLLAFSLAFSLVACSSGNNAGGGSSDEGGDEGLQEPLSEQKWRDAFDFSNVSVVAELSANRILLAEKVSHKYEGNAHTMDIEVKNFEQLGGASWI